MALSMMVEMTSLTPRVTRRTPAIAAQRAPVTIATRMATTVFSGPGSQAWPAKAAAANPARRYWPSTPMLNRFIRKPMAAATPEKYRRAVVFRMLTMLRWPGTENITSQKPLTLSPLTSSTSEATTPATTNARSGAATASAIRRLRLMWHHRPR